MWIQVEGRVNVSKLMPSHDPYMRKARRPLWLVRSGQDRKALGDAITRGSQGPDHVGHIEKFRIFF